MKKVLLAISLFSLIITSCGANHPENSSNMIDDSFTVVWKNFDDTILETDINVSYGTMPSYDGETPVRPEDNDYIYTWSGWTPEPALVTSNQTYKATYSFEKKKTEYTIDFDLNGGTSNSYTGPVIVNSFSKDIFFFDCVKEGWNFRGWSYNGVKVFDEKGNQLANPVMANSMTFVALFAQTAKMTIVSNIEGAGSISGEGEYPYNTYVDISANAYQGYVFVGWYYDGTPLSNTNDYRYMMWSEDVTLEARFKLDSFLMNIYSNNEDYGLVLLKSASNNDYLTSYEEYREYTSDVTIAAYSKTDVRFLGWYDTNNELVETNAVYSFVMPNHDYTLEAKWNYFTISYNLDGGNGASYNPTSYTIDDAPISLNNPTKTGYDFVGWKYGDEYITTINPQWADNIVVDAVWTPIKNWLSVTSSNASKGSASIVSGSGYSDEAITVAATPIGDYAFEGWYHKSTLVSYEATYTFIMPTNDYSLVAYFFTKAEEEERNKALGIIPVVDSIKKTVTYGLYPQKNVNDSNLLVSLNSLTTQSINGWYLYNNEFYAKVIAKPSYSSYYFDNAVSIKANTVYWFKCEPITWNILSNNDGDYFVLSSMLLDALCYDTLSDNYKNSGIRYWLNNEFYNSAFALGDNRIKVTYVDNSAETTHYSENRDVCENTQDKVFLPSYKDYLNTSYGFHSFVGGSNSRTCKTTDWARARGASYSTDSHYLYNGYYWTRSPTGGSNHASFISHSGNIEDSKVSITAYSTRPAITIAIN